MEASRRGARGLASKEAPRGAAAACDEPEEPPLESSSDDAEGDARTPPPPPLLPPPPPLFGGSGSAGTPASPGIPPGSSFQATAETTKGPGEAGVAVRTTVVEARGLRVTATEGVEQQGSGSADAAEVVAAAVAEVAAAVPAPPPPPPPAAPPAAPPFCFALPSLPTATATSLTPSSLSGIDIGLKKLTETETGSPTTAEKCDEGDDAGGGGGRGRADAAAAAPLPPPPPPLLVSAASNPLQTPAGAPRDAAPHQVTRASVVEGEDREGGEREGPASAAAAATVILSTTGTGAGGGATPPPFVVAEE